MTELRNRAGGAFKVEYGRMLAEAEPLFCPDDGGDDPLFAEPEPFHLDGGKEHPGDPFYSEENLKWIRESIEQGNQGKYIVKTIEELEAMESSNPL